MITHIDREVADAIAEFFKDPRDGWWWISEDRTVSLEGKVPEGEPPVIMFTDNAPGGAL